MIDQLLITKQTGAAGRLCKKVMVAERVSPSGVLLCCHDGTRVQCKLRILKKKTQETLLINLIIYRVPS